MQLILYFLATIGGLTILFVIFRLKIFQHLGLIIHQNLDISLQELMFMYFRNSNVDLILKLLIISKKANIIIDKSEIEAYILGGLDTESALQGLIYAKGKGYQLDLKEAITCVASKKNIFDSINNWTRVNPNNRTITQL
ncbi:flotillin-like FloA family protein [Carboxylicivirga linearis]|uniref:Flotillin-like FloA family protein n=1 Tax=Carboxylicivirga linearis TaxID=1628157 RepID=A0ABS5K4A1_9BACT|nr:flotillin-like FloA family protein [Carboxylicivirga linearis]MBS2101156.1 flotillin-like FloA family protein [Carboxylicivirga linearis]